MTPLDLHFCVQVHSHSDEFLESDLATSHCLQCWVFCRRLFFEGVWKPWIRGSSRPPALMVWDCRLNARSLFSDLEFCSQASALNFDSVSSHPDPEALNPKSTGQMLQSWIGRSTWWKERGLWRVQQWVSNPTSAPSPFPTALLQLCDLGQDTWFLWASVSSCVCQEVCTGAFQF